MSRSKLQQHLHTILPCDSRASLRDSLLPALVLSISAIARCLRGAHDVRPAGTANGFGDVQLNVDVAAEQILRDALARCRSVKTASSEEDAVERAVWSRDDGEQYTVAFDPLDGSSIIAPAWTVGSIMGIWDGGSALGQPPAEKQVAAVLGVYGPRTVAVVAVRLPGTTGTCFEMAVGEECEVVRACVRLDGPPFERRYFAPANLRAAAESERYAALVGRCIRQKYTLRYSGGLVPDVVHALVKGHGVYMSPVTAQSGAKLRRLYELCPVALVVECAGGKAVDPVDGSHVLATPVATCDERAGLVCGTADEVDMAVEALLGRSTEEEL